MPPPISDRRPRSTRPARRGTVPACRVAPRAGSRTHPAASAATSNARLSIIGTTMAMKVSGSAKSSPRPAGSCAPMATPATVDTCQPAQSPKPEPNSIQWANSRRGLPARRQQVGNRRRIGLVGQQVGQQQFPAPGQARQQRRDRRAVKRMAQVDQADGTRAEQQRRAGPRQLREQELGGPGEDDGGHRHRRQRRYAALQRDHAIDHAEWRNPQQQGQNRAQAKQESLARSHLREGMFTMTMPPTTMAAARMKCRLG
jgi:hypothetical protein